jgi:alkylation response protein AidB-like acyl-CoA dehydrogenase
MDVDLTDQQVELRCVARAFLEQHAPPESVRLAERDLSTFDSKLWQAMAGLGWQGLVMPEEHGGAGLGLIELVIVMEEVGRALCGVPFCSTATATLALLEGGTSDQQRAWLPSIASGETIWSVAFAEELGGWDPADLRTSITADDDAFVVDGTKMFVDHANVAQFLVVLGASGSSASSLPVAVIVDTRQTGIEVELLETIGRDRQAVVRFDHVIVPAGHLLSGPSSSDDWLRRVIDQATLLECAYMVGLARRDLELAVSHVTSRVQFGKTLAAFQAVQHHLANMLTDVDGAQLITYKAAWSLANGMSDASMSVSIAKAWCCESTQRVVKAAQQLSGAMGFTEEYDSQLYFRRQKRSEFAWGDADYHRERIAQLMHI